MNATGRTIASLVEPGRLRRILARMLDGEPSARMASARYRSGTSSIPTSCSQREG